uniref:Aquaporin n=1 Tax=Prunus cerasifera TaxID=36595 RepID=A0A2Z3YL16_9ROSA|nr:aquaporin [Prunus cerasifera]
MALATKESDGIEEEISKIEKGLVSTSHNPGTNTTDDFRSSAAPPRLPQKFIAELIGTYFVIFAGCGSVAVNKIYGNVTFPGVCVTWGLIVMAMIYSVGHISGAHFNPAVTITFGVLGRFSFREIVAQLLGSTMASGTIAVLLDVTPKAYVGTVPVGSNGQSLVFEIIISFLLMFVISGASTDSRAIGDVAGVAVGMTILLNVFIAGPVSGASMNPARSLGPAIVKHVYKGLWVYIVGPITGGLAGGIAYNFIRSKPLAS